ncbi:hypothetical protein AMTRI_Chr12g239150 [Amborella trichopoda]|uniref:Uncharacterized protein n=1 Tax=Amborella trichopoda TaxID=13333 RepID=U5D816_AMBTC|nr:hypothetical protein AMTR_s00065p00153390 [Amborella trichopoda]
MEVSRNDNNGGRFRNSIRSISNRARALESTVEKKPFAQSAVERPKPPSFPKNYVTLAQLQERLLQQKEEEESAKKPEGVNRFLRHQQFGLENTGSRNFGENGGYRVKQEEEKSLENTGSRKFGENVACRVKQEEEKMEKGTLTLALGEADNEIHRVEELNQESKKKSKKWTKKKKKKKKKEKAEDTPTQKQDSGQAKREKAEETLTLESGGAQRSKENFHGARENGGTKPGVSNGRNLRGNKMKTRTIVLDSKAAQKEKAEETLTLILTSKSGRSNEIKTQYQGSENGKIKPSKEIKKQFQGSSEKGKIKPSKEIKKQFQGSSEKGKIKPSKEIMKTLTLESGVAQESEISSHGACEKSSVVQESDVKSHGACEKVGQTPFPSNRKKWKGKYGFKGNRFEETEKGERDFIKGVPSGYKWVKKEICPTIENEISQKFSGIQ